jgi:hypothetical protein
LARPALLFSLTAFFLANGCSKADIEPTYKENNIPSIIKKICREEYNLDVTTKRTGSTIWIYAPMTKMLHKDYGKEAGKIFDEELIDKLRNIIITIGRVLISSDNTPDFYCLTASDINLGIDYTLMGYVMDIKKSYAEFIPWPEANRRYVIKFQLAGEAIGDKTGAHVKTYSINLPEFLSDQIVQRVSAALQEEEVKKYFQVEKFEGRFEKGIFYFDYTIKQTAQPKEDIDITGKILNIISYCLRTYEFNDFSGVVLTDLLTQNKLDLNKAAIIDRAKEL